jgi:3-hydroxyacyl-CoA dehydrogenase
MKYKKITVAGSGVLGSQIAFQTAFKGFDVTVYDVSDEALAGGRCKIDNLAGIYAGEIRRAEVGYEKASAGIQYNRNLLPGLAEMLGERIACEIRSVEELPSKIKFTSDLAAAAADADLLIEAIPERVNIKADFYTKLSTLAPAKTVFATNSSTLLPSMFAAYTGRPDRFLALHFANEIWHNNTAEVMGHADTSEEVYNDVVEFAEAIGMVPLKLKKEQPGYILNSILVPFLEAAQSLLVNNVADVETIDMTWKLGTGARVGPFQILDVVGVQTAYNILKNYADTSSDPDSEHARLATMLKRDYLDKGHTGVAAGEGFYKYN